jgi:hypothetical protein
MSIKMCLRYLPWTWRRKLENDVVLVYVLRKNPNDKTLFIHLFIFIYFPIARERNSFAKCTWQLKSLIRRWFYNFLMLTLRTTICGLLLTIISQLSYQHTFNEISSAGWCCWEVKLFSITCSHCWDDDFRVPIAIIIS